MQPGAFPLDYRTIIHYVVREAGYDPARPFGHQGLSLARLPVPALSHLVPAEGVEPSILAVSGLKPDVYSNSTTQAYRASAQPVPLEADDRLRIPVILGDLCEA